MTKTSGNLPVSFAIKAQGRNNLPFFLPPGGIVAYEETTDGDFLAVTLTATRSGPLLVRATVNEMDAVLAASMICFMIPVGSYVPPSTISSFLTFFLETVGSEW